jgi:predicted lipid-binding transport protein (Tim44 family)
VSSGFNPVIAILILGVVVVIVVIVLRRTLNTRPSPTLPPLEPADRPSGMDEFLAANPDFDLAAFTAKIGSAFMIIQKAWTDQDISRARRFISDGMYQRFATQFRMMGLLKQRNVLDQIQVFNVQPVAFWRDGAYDVIDVWISATMHDSFACELDPSMNTEGDDPFAEYWSLIRKRGARNTGFDLVAAQNCPSCGAALPEAMGELCRCAHCQVLVNSGEFDWVLAEITQEADYGEDSRMAANVSPDLEQAIAAIAPQCPDFSQQLAEDKASNAFMQIMTAHATRNPASVRRFVTDEVFTAISAEIPDRSIIFNRIYLNESTLLDVERDGTKHRLSLGLSASLQRVELLPAGRLAVLDAEEQRLDYFLTMERDVDAVSGKGSLYQHQCANCGGRVGDTIDVKCQYCGSALNSTRNEWIVCGFEGG